VDGYAFNARLLQDLLEGLKEWSVEGIWSKMLKALVSKGYSLGKLSPKRVALDSIIQARKGVSS